MYTLVMASSANQKLLASSARRCIPLYVRSEAMPVDAVRNED